MKRIKTIGAIFIIMISLLVTSCSISNPLSELSWGTATIQGRVTRTSTVSGNTIIEGVPGAFVKTDSGTEQTFTNEQGYYNLTITFRIGSAAKEKKIKVMAFDKENSAKNASISDIYIRDGLTTYVPPITWAK